MTVLKVTTPDRQDRRKQDNDDAPDTQNTARATFTGQRIVTPRSHDGMMEAVRMLVAGRQTAVTARRITAEVIHNTIVTAPASVSSKIANAFVAG